MGFTTKTKKVNDEEVEYTQLQNVEMLKGKLKKQTLKLNSVLTEKELNSLKGKVIETDIENGLIEYSDGVTQSFVCDTYKVINETIENDRTIETSLIITLSNYKLDKERKTTLLQYVETKNNNIQVIDIKLKEMIFDLSKYINKQFLVKNINMYQDPKTKKRYYSSLDKPIELKD